jgi:hypothetical protein
LDREESLPGIKNRLFEDLSGIVAGGFELEQRLDREVDGTVRHRAADFLSHSHIIEPGGEWDTLGDSGTGGRGGGVSRDIFV